MSEVSKSGKGIVNYFKTNEALVPRSFRRSVKEIFRLVKSGLVCMAWACVAFSGYLAFNPSQSPVTFERELAKIVECSQETIEGKQRYTVTIDEGEIQTKFVELSEDLWVDATNVSNVPNSTMVEKFNQVKNAKKASKELGLESPDMDMSVKTYSIIPSLK